MKDLARTIEALGTTAREETLDTVKKQDQTAERALRTVIERAPGEILRLVRETVTAAADAAESSTSLTPRERAALPVLARTIRTFVHDPRNAREAAEALDALAAAVDHLPTVRAWTERALDILEDRKVLGQGTLTQITTALLAASAAGAIAAHRYTQGGEAVLAWGDSRISLTKLGTYSASLAHHDARWAGEAMRLVLEGRVETGGAHPGVRANTVLAKAPIAVLSGAIVPGGGVVRRGDELRGRASLDVVTRPSAGVSLRPSAAVEVTHQGVRAVEGGVSARIQTEKGGRGQSLFVAPSASMRQDIQEGRDVRAGLELGGRFGAQDGDLALERDLLACMLGIHPRRS